MHSLPYARTNFIQGISQSPPQIGYYGTGEFAWRQIPADRNSADIQILTSDRVAEIRRSLGGDRFPLPERERASEELNAV